MTKVIEVKNSRSIFKSVVSYLGYIVGLLVSSIAASFLTVGIWIFYCNKFTFDGMEFDLMALLVVIGNVLALPGLLIFLNWSWYIGRKAGSDFGAYITAGLFIAGINGVFIVDIFDDTVTDVHEARSILVLFAVTGAITAFFHWQIIRYWKSPAVTLFRESAKKELYSQF